ncbi:hypothetical protein OSTOST_20707 [Ostertagia ostertagi]
MLLALSQLSPFCAMQIHRCLKSNSLSSRTKAIQKKMLILLSIQITSPTLFMNLPLGIMFLLLFTGLPSPPFIDNFVGIAMALYPLMGPIITVVFVKDYRKVLLTTLHISKKVNPSTIPPAITVRTASTCK